MIEIPKPCDHPAAHRTSVGPTGEALPRFPLRWGSAETEACGICGAFRLPRHGRGETWYPGPVDEAVAEARREEEEDWC